jgi:8-oxo-dGTP diphosphatase
MRTIQRDIAGAFIFSKDNKILLGKTNVYADLWVVPGGGIEKGETELQALRREILEEVGIDINEAKVEEIDIKVTGQGEKTLRDTGERVLVEMKFYNYKVLIPKGATDIKVAASDDLTDAKWFNMAELREIPLSPPTKTSLEKQGYL